MPSAQDSSLLPSTPPAQTSMAGEPPTEDGTSRHACSTLITTQANDELLHAGLDLLDQGFTIFNERLQLVAWNRSFLRLLDFPEAMAYPGASFASFIRYNAARGEYGPGNADALTEKIVARAIRFTSHTTERQRPDGRIVAIRGAPLPHQGFIALYSDITEERWREAAIEDHNRSLEERVSERTAAVEAAHAQLLQANAANLDITASLRRSEERLRLITDGVPANIGYFDHEQIFRYANKGYCEWFSRPVNEIVGHSAESVLGPQVWPTVRDHVARALTGVRVRYEYALPRPNGHLAFAQSTLVPEFSPAGKVLGCFVLALDITEQKRTQAALAQALKMEAIGQLAGGIAHDFNNMLTVVIGNLGLLQEARHRTGPSADDSPLDAALQAARRGVELIRRLLAVSRQQPLAPQAIDPGHLVREMAQLIRRSLPESIELKLNTPEPGSTLVARADPNQLDSALLNLILNARDAMPHGGAIEVTVRGRELSASDAIDHDLPPGPYIAISVSDNGAGMTPDILARVFEPFFTTKAYGKGNGLGMTMVYGFTSQSGGSIRLSSQSGMGTTVCLLLPAIDDVIESAPLPLPQEQPSGHRPLVLLVEDEPQVRQIVRRQLTELGYPVIEAENGQEALMLLDAVSDIGLLLSDVIMPGGLNGWQLAQQTQARRPEIRVVLMSGYTDPDTAAAFAEPRPVLLAKPFSPAQLAAALAGNS